MVFLLKDEKDADRVACFQRPPKKYTSKDEPWVSTIVLPFGYREVISVF